MSSDAEVVRAGFEVAFAPVRDLFNRLLGPAADTVGGIIADPIRIYRFEKSVRLLEKVKRICQEAGFEPRAVPLKTLLPIFEYGSLEEDEDLQEGWANLLSNAASPYSKVHPSFPDILRQLAPQDARFLEGLVAVYNQPDSVERRYIFNAQGVTALRGLRIIWDELRPKDTQVDEDTQFDDPILDPILMMAVDTLLRLNLIYRSPITKGDLPYVDIYSVSPLGHLFVRACKRPSKTA